MPPELPALAELQNTSTLRFSFWCDDVPEAFVVDAFRAVEELDAPFLIELRLTAELEATDTSDLLGRDAHLRLERDGHARSFCGLVTRVVVLDDGEQQQRSVIEVRPALGALRLTRATRIFQDQTALETIREVLAEGLRPYGRRVDVSRLDASRYPSRDFCVQYRESPFDFVHRLLEEEGIGYYFEHDEAVETLVLFDRQQVLERAPTMDDGPVQYDHEARVVTSSEPIRRFRVGAQLSSTGVVLRDHDWTRGRPQIDGADPGDGAATTRGERSHEVYDHGFARALTITEDDALLATMLELVESAALPEVIPIGFDARVRSLPGFLSDAFTSNDAAHQATIRRELLRRDAKYASGEGVVIGFAPGSTFDLVGHPTLGADGSYYLTKVTHSGGLDAAAVADHHDASSRIGENYRNEFHCRRAGVEWRPARDTEKPRIYGVQTATVTGPVGSDVHTDQHGRVKVRFNWDRAEVDLSGNYTCWLRVSQIWAGEGAPGFLFIPRVGMEVVVSFIDGDPDRPLVTGCVYNGQHPTPGLLPRQATKSIIRTRSIPHGPGHNELSFEDAMGREVVHLRAERDLDELVRNDHRMLVQRDRRITVGADQTEHVAGNQHQLVGGARNKIVAGDETEVTSGHHQHVVDGSAHLELGGTYRIDVEEGGMITDIDRGEYVVHCEGRMLLAQHEENSLSMVSKGADKGIFLEAKGSTIHIAEDKIELVVGGSTLLITAESIKANMKTMPAPPGGASGGE